MYRDPLEEGQVFLLPSGRLVQITNIRQVNITARYVEADVLKEQVMIRRDWLHRHGQRSYMLAANDTATWKCPHCHADLPSTPPPPVVHEPRKKPSANESQFRNDAEAPAAAVSACGTGS